MSNSKPDGEAPTTVSTRPVPERRGRAITLDIDESLTTLPASSQALRESALASEHVAAARADGNEPAPSSLSERENLTGRVLDGRYQVEYVLGVGSMGVVYAARQAGAGKLVALKALRQHLATDPEATQRFNVEATAATAIGNQHIVETLDYGKLTDGTAYLVMEYLEGSALAEVIERAAPLPLARILHIARQIAVGLGAAHDAGIVHRDLKPDNVYLCQRVDDADFVKILDFGIAKFGAGQARLTHAGAVFGTPAYMAPEQAVGNTTDGRTDVYALGVIMYEMASGRVPFRGESAVAVLTMQATELPPALRSLAPAVSRELEAIVHRCLQKEPDQRYASMAELGLDLARLAEGIPVHAERVVAHPPRAAEARAAPGGAGPRAPRPSSVPILLAVLLGLALAVSLWQHRKSEPIPPTIRASEPIPVLPPLASDVSPLDPAVVPSVAMVLFPLDARVFVDKVDLGAMPVSVPVPAGQTVKVLVKREGYWTRKVVLDGSKNRLVIGLVKRDSNKPPPDAEDAPLPPASAAEPTVADDDAERR